MKILNYAQLSQAERASALARPGAGGTRPGRDGTGGVGGEDLAARVAELIAEVRERGDAALLDHSAKFDGLRPESLSISPEELTAAASQVDEDLREAILIAYANIRSFHAAQQPVPIAVETVPGVSCELLYRPLESVGLYVPGGSAPLFSSLLMMAAPARLASCPRIVLATPPPAHPALLFCAGLCGVDECYLMGGAGAIAALAYGTASVRAVDKIFGPGNAYVAEAKRQVAAAGVAIDMQAGPSEVLVIADERARADFVAADLLAQAEHGPDSQAILLCLSEDFARRAAAELASQLQRLPRRALAQMSIANSRIIILQDLAQCVKLSNAYAPEHLIINTAKPRELLAEVKNAGSIFLGSLSPEALGDYASGTNHVLPTYGLARAHSGLGLGDFMKKISVQEASEEGLKILGPVVECLARAEGLAGHERSVSLRLGALSEKGKQDG